MPTQRLIDINTAAITYRRECLQALKMKHFRTCIGSIITLNAELPADDGDHKYRIVIDSGVHYDAVKQNFIILCKDCTTKDKPTEHPYYHIEFFDVNLSRQDQIITGIMKERIWLCPKCNVENQLLTSKIIRSSLQKPYYLRTVPEPPKSQQGLLSKIQFNRDMEDWVWLCLNAIEEGFTRFRDDNWNKADPYDEMYDVDTSIEEGTKNAD